MSSDLKYSLYVIISALAGAAGLIATEVAVRSMGVPVLQVAVTSNLVAGGLLLSLAACGRTVQWRGWGRADWLRLLLGAAATYAAGFLLLYEAIGRIGTSKVSLLGRLETVFIVLLAVLFLKETWTRRHWVGGLLAMTGAVLVNFDPGALRLDLGWGEVLAVCAALVFATGIVLLKSVLNRWDGLLVTGYGMLVAVLILCPFLLGDVLSNDGAPDAAGSGGGALAPDLEFGAAAVMGLLVLRGILLAISWICYNVAMQHIGASRSSVLFLSFAFMAVLLQVSLHAVAPGLGLQLPAHLELAVLGGVVICAGIYFISKAPKSRTA